MEFKIDFHVHSDASPDGMSSIGDLAKAAAGAGLSAIAIADHNMFTLSEIVEQDGVLLLPACEISTRRGHILALMCSEPIDMEKLMASGIPSAEDAAAAIHGCGGIAVVAHPFDRRERDLSGMQELIDGVETANSRAYFHNLNANKMAKEFADEFRLLEFGGSDAHSVKAVGNCYTSVFADSFEDVRSAIESGNGKAVFVRNTPKIQKGLSQFKMARNSGSAYKFIRGIAYVCYCALKDVFER